MYTHQLRFQWFLTERIYQIRPFLKIRRVALRRKILLSRPSTSKYKRPITAWLFFSGSESELQQTTELVLDYPGGGFISMTPEHHEERLSIWALKTNRPVLSIEYGKGPECRFPHHLSQIVY